MNYKLFKVCLNEDQLNSVKEPFFAFDNIENKRPDLLEYHIFKRLIDEGHTENLDMWGVFSHRMDEKLRYSSDIIFNDINSNPRYDVYIFNHARVINSITNNVWEHGEFAHRGILKVSKFVLEKAGYDPSVTDVLMDENTCCYSSYFVATKEFWIKYMNFLDSIKHHLDNSLTDELNSIYMSSAGYARNSKLSLFPFIIERLFSTYLILNFQNLKIYHRPYDYSVYRQKCGESYKIFESLNNIKSIVVRMKSAELYAEWNKLRMFYMRTNLDPLSLD